MITKERVTIIASMTAARTPILSKSVRMWPYVVEASSSGLGPVRELCPRGADRDVTEVLETMARRSATLTPTRCESSLRVASGRPAGRGAGFTATVSAPRLSDAATVDESLVTAGRGVTRRPAGRCLPPGNRRVVFGIAP
jgi:hypothetical protein